MSEKSVRQSTIDKYLGKVFPSNNYGNVEVIEVLGGGKFKVKFLNTGNERIFCRASITKGEMRDVAESPVYTTGIQDIKGYLTKGVPNPKDYSVWNGIRQRCYNENNHHRVPSYEGCSMSDDFLVFSKFKGWYGQQIGHDQEGWELDKDILVRGNKIYSEDTCCFVPHEVNSLILQANGIRGEYPVGVYYEKETGKFKVRISVGSKQRHIGRYMCKTEAFEAYKQAKEKHIKVIANKWKDKIDPLVYEALINWTVKITD